MTDLAVDPAISPADAAATEDEQRVPRAGWVIVAGKELSDHLTSVRFIVLLLLLGLAALVPLYFASGLIRDAAQQASGAEAVFLAMFTLSSSDYPILRVDTFVSIVAPLLGLAFAFDAVNGERADGTLPRLLAQPIHRDDVINGKFAAGLAVISLVLVCVTAVIAGFGLVRLGISPAGSEVFRIIAWLVITILWVALWLAIGLLLSVIFRRAATSALIGFGFWIVITIFGSLITNLVAGFVAPLASATSNEQAISLLQTQSFIAHLLPTTLYNDATTVILNPGATAAAVSAPGSLGQIAQANQQIPTLLSLDQSLLLVWPQVVALVALTVVCFALAYVLFMRQEVRA